MGLRSEDEDRAQKGWGMAMCGVIAGSREPGCVLLWSLHCSFESWNKSEPGCGARTAVSTVTGEFHGHGIPVSVRMGR